MTNLDRDIIRAKQLGYGVHYGWYKADYPVTNTDAIELNETAHDGYFVRKCEHCGKMFTKAKHNQRFCSTHCQQLEACKRYYGRKKDGL